MANEQLSTRAAPSIHERVVRQAKRRHLRDKGGYVLCAVLEMLERDERDERDERRKEARR